jgi:predicted RNase H-like HicB family nuclease
MYRFLVVIEKANGNYSAYSPDLPGCIATGATREEVERNMHEAIELHVQGLLEDNLPKGHFARPPAVRRHLPNKPELIITRRNKQRKRDKSY